MRLALSVVALVIVACSANEAKSDLERCVDEKTAEYERLYPDQPSSRETIRDNQRIFCDIYLKGRRERQGNGVK